MHKNHWKLQDAKNHFSEVVRKAQTEGPQKVTKSGENAVVVVSYALYRSLTETEDNLVDFLQNSPLKGVNLDLKRRKDLPREVDL